MAIECYTMVRDEEGCHLTYLSERRSRTKDGLLRRFCGEVFRRYAQYAGIDLLYFLDSFRLLKRIRIQANHLNPVPAEFGGHHARHSFNGGAGGGDTGGSGDFYPGQAG